MGELGLTEITNMGMKHLENWLNQNGFTDIEIDNWQPGSVDVKAKGTVENILVQAKTVEFPAEHSAAGGTDKFALKDLAERLDRVPYMAFIVIDKNKELVGEIVWERIY
jgi:hypothetical protein